MFGGYWVILLILFDFGNEWTSSSMCTSQHSLPVGLWVRAHRYTLVVSTRVGSRGDYMMNCYFLTNCSNIDEENEILLGINQWIYEYELKLKSIWYEEQQRNLLGLLLEITAVWEKSHWKGWRPLGLVECVHGVSSMRSNIVRVKTCTAWLNWLTINSLAADIVYVSLQLGIWSLWFWHTPSFCWAR